MKLKFKNLENKKFTVVPEEDIKSFGEKTIDFARETIVNAFGNDYDYDITNIQDFILGGILEFSKNIKKFENSFFICEPSEGTLLWNVIVDNDVIILDSYEVDMINEDINLYFSCEISVINDNSCEVSINLYGYPEEEQANLNIEMIKLSALLRLNFYIIMLNKKNNI